MNVQINSGNSLSFHTVTIADKPIVDRYMQPYGQCSCQHTFATLFTLSEKYGSMICECSGFFFTLREKLCSDGKRVYLAPMGGGDLKSAYDAILSDASAHNCKAVFNTVTSEHVNFLKKNYPGRFKYTELRDLSEYIYLSKNLYSMSGNALAGKRTEVRHILRTYGERLELRYITSDKISDIWEFEQKWYADSLSTHDEFAMMLKNDSVRKQLENFDALDTLCIAAYLDGEAVGFTYGVPLNNYCFDGLVIQARRDIPHLYTLLYWGMSCLCAPAFTYFNWEEDVGVPGLRSLKMHYEPAVLMRKYLVEESDVVSGTPEPDSIPILSSIGFYPGEELISGNISFQRGDFIQITESKQEEQ